MMPNKNTKENRHGTNINNYGSKKTEVSTAKPPTHHPKRKKTRNSMNRYDFI
ncbi:hypothetical protein [Planococcus faecalis]|uniref:hypothetical protein n=1 Tax=Planococcus faecalis TaxID=1598147 RepID=UPI0015A4F889|nr:hypothetical protein [Planococcus faecalis]